MTHHPKPMLRLITNHAHHCDTLARMNAPRIRKDQARARYVLAALCFALGMALAAIAASHAYAGALDAIAHPFLEGFE